MDYQKFTFSTTDTIVTEILIARLSEIGFEAFEEGEVALYAYIPATKVDIAEVNAISSDMAVDATSEIIPRQNWNAQWEAGYEPVVIDDFCTVRAQFHPPADTQYEIIITPKMSFGTGHHATTKLMIEAMSALDFKGREVLDFGTGTGILAILAAKLGAATVVAIDHEDWAVANAIENVALNGAESIEVYQGSLEQAGTKSFDVMLANINRHILLQYINMLSTMLNPGGYLLLSGILIGDEEVISVAAVKAMLKLVSRSINNQWMALVYSK